MMMKMLILFAFAISMTALAQPVPLENGGGGGGMGDSPIGGLTAPAQVHDFSFDLEANRWITRADMNTQSIDVEFADQTANSKCQDVVGEKVCTLGYRSEPRTEPKSKMSHEQPPVISTDP